MNRETLKETIRKELPELLRADPEFKACILEITRDQYADRKDTANWFHEMLDEMRRERERQDQRWDEHLREREAKWEKHLKAQEAYREKADERWDEHLRERAAKWEKHIQEETRKWEIENRRSQKGFDRVHEEIMAMARKYDRSIGALGARWGIQSERSFRNALAGILEENFGVEVLNVNEYDDQGVVFGRPDQVELDVIIKNGLLLVCELKSSIDKASMYIFERKVRFYESRHNQKADRLIVISPMIDPKAQKVAKQLNIETYSDSLEVENLDSD